MSGESREPGIKVRRDGPLKVARHIGLFDHEGDRIEIPDPDRPYVLCRCGASSNKPFCDGSHSEIGFDGSGPALADDPEGGEG